jgi:hypothetical protein
VCPVNLILAYTSVSSVRVETVNNQLGVVMPVVSATADEDSHPVHEVEYPIFIIVLSSFEWIIGRVDNKSAISFDCIF